MLRRHRYTLVKAYQRQTSAGVLCVCFTSNIRKYQVPPQYFCRRILSPPAGPDIHFSIIFYHILYSMSSILQKKCKEWKIMERVTFCLRRLNPFEKGLRIRKLHLLPLSVQLKFLTDSKQRAIGIVITPLKF